jgi:RNA polymerase sigma-70 factor (ECF subfamily)
MVQMSSGLSQKLLVECSSNVNAANDGVIAASFDDARVDLETIFQTQYERIARVIAGIIKDPARAEELAVEVFLKWERTAKAHGEGAEGWLFRTAVRAGLNELRRNTLRSRYERLLGFLARVTSAASAPDEIYSVQEQEKRVRLALSAIDPRQAELLLLRCNDLSYQELAAALNLNPASVGTLLSRALAAFRKEFIQRYGKERYGYK